MADNNELIKALGQVPELVEKTEKVLEDSDKKFRILAEAAQKRMQAEIPSFEIKKVSDAAAAAVSHTKCATPDTDEVSRIVAENVTKHLSDSIGSLTTNAVKETLKETPVKVEHFHSHTTLGYMTKMADNYVRNLIIILILYAAAVTLAGIAIAHIYFNSELYTGSKYYDVYSSSYTTKTEKKMLETGSYIIGVIPKEFSETPSLVKQKIKYNLKVLKRRKAEADANEGRFSTEPQLER